MRIAIACDEAGQTAKVQLAAKLISTGHDVYDAAPPVSGNQRGDGAEQVALAVLRHDAERGIVISSRAVGAAIAANRVPGVCAAHCADAHSARVAAQEEGMNVLVLAVHTMNDQHVAEIVDAYLGAELAPIEIVGGLPPRRLQRVLSHITDNLARDLTVAELAQVVGMSQYYFSKLFKMSTGTTPHQFIMRKRVERAQECLRTTGTALSEIATLVGFETQSHFTSVFRRLAGITPKRYRDMHETTPGEVQAREQPAEGKSATAA